MKIISLIKIMVLLFLVSCQSSLLGNLLDTSSNEKKNKYVRPKEAFSKEAQLNIPYRSLDRSKVITQFGFGSCNDQNKPQPLWKLIQKKSPQLFIMMGDNVYASKPETRPIIDQYIKLNSNTDYLDLRESVPFLATWDDHDYGLSDGGFDNPDKAEAKRIFTKYWSYTKDLLPPDQSAIYHSRIVGEKNRRIQFIMLDTRTDRTALVPNIINLNHIESADTTLTPSKQNFKMFQPNQDPKAQILSSGQWKWLEAELKKPAELRILVSSIQILANDTGFEKWGNFPLEREKFLNLIQKNKIKNLVILSGDRHHASVSKMPLKGFDLYEITGSSLNKISKATEPENDPLYITPSYLGLNFGMAEVNWDKKEANFEIYGEDDKIKISQKIKF